MKKAPTYTLIILLLLTIPIVSEETKSPNPTAIEYCTKLANGKFEVDSRLIAPATGGAPELRDLNDLANEVGTCIELMAAMQALKQSLNTPPAAEESEQTTGRVTPAQQNKRDIEGLRILLYELQNNLDAPPPLETTTVGNTPALPVPAAPAVNQPRLVGEITQGGVRHFLLGRQGEFTMVPVGATYEKKIMTIRGGVVFWGDTKL